MPTSLLDRKQTHFVFWRPGPADPAPKLVIGVFKGGSPPTLDQQKDIPLKRSVDSDEVWEVAAAACGLQDGQVYHYWFEVTDTAPFRSPHPTLRCTDPAAYGVDWRLRANGGDDEAAAAVIRFQNGRLLPSDPEMVPPLFGAQHRDVPMKNLPVNDRLVIYELPTAWTKSGDVVDEHNVGVGTFRDVQALIEKGTRGGHFAHLRRLRDHQHLIDLGTNALELLPPADTFVDRRIPRCPRSRTRRRHPRPSATSSRSLTRATGTGSGSSTTRSWPSRTTTPTESRTSSTFMSSSTTGIPSRTTATALEAISGSTPSCTVPSIR